MNLINVDNIEKRFSDRMLFTDTSFGVQEKEKIAIIGANGCGKSSLLKILAGVEPPDSGNVIRSSGARIAVLEQLPKSNPNDTIGEHILCGKGERAAALRAYELCAARAEAGDTDAAMELASHAEVIDHLDAWGL